ncbi:MAG: transporter substrate-binding domain-containing protein, partial [Holosporales bacterium]|nr:transporter substrate-binding domain-containing protein [Holosporales bacterium]
MKTSRRSVYVFASFLALFSLFTQNGESQEAVPVAPEATSENGAAKQDGKGEPAAVKGAASSESKAPEPKKAEESSAPPPEPEKPKRIIVAIPADYPPFSFKVRASLVGFDVEIANTIGASL